MVNERVKDIVNKVSDGLLPSADELRFLLSLESHSGKAGFVMGAADHINRMASEGKAEVPAQIGLNLSPCPRNCSFCSILGMLFTYKPGAYLRRV